MYITPSQLQGFDEEKLKKFLAQAIPENYYLDYKVNLSGDTSDKQHKEFLKDVTAFANAHGGDILIGVKEPQEGLPSDEQIVGIEDGSGIAQKLKDIAFSCIDPRIPGFAVLPISLSNGKSVILVNIPPSLTKPHMVDFKRGGIRDFFLRGNDSSRPMSSFEIKQSVLNSATAEIKAMEYMHKKEIDSMYYFVKDCPAFLIQAMPMILPEHPIDVLSAEIVDIISGKNRSSRFDTTWGLICLAHPYPTIDGVQAKEGYNKSNWHLNFNRNGYIGLSFYNLFEHYGPDNITLSKKHGRLFRSYCDLCNQLINATSLDVPFVVKCKYVNAKSTSLFAYERLIPYEKHEIEWPDQIRQPGESFIPIAETWLEQMYHAFGEEFENE